MFVDGTVVLQFMLYPVVGSETLALIDWLYCMSLSAVHRQQITRGGWREQGVYGSV